MLLVAAAAGLVVSGVTFLWPSTVRSATAAAAIRPAESLGSDVVYSMSVPGIKGPGGTGGTGTIPLESVSFGVAATVRDPATGMPTGKREHSAITITKEWDVASPALFVAGAAGTRLGTIAIFVQPPDGAPGAAFEIMVKGAVVGGDSWSGAAAESPTETVTLTYQKIEVKYTTVAGT